MGLRGSQPLVAEIHTPFRVPRFFTTATKPPNKRMHPCFNASQVWNKNVSELERPKLGTIQ